MTYLAKDTMTKELITVGWRSNLGTAYNLMRKNEIRHLPVRNDTGDIVGILSERDALKAMRSEINHVPDPKMTAAFTHFSDNDLVKDFMSWPVKSVKMTDSLEQAVHKMLEEKISAVMVTGHKNTIEGIVTTDDLISLLLTFLKEDSEKKYFEVGRLFESNWVSLTN